MAQCRDAFFPKYSLQASILAAGEGPLCGKERENGVPVPPKKERVGEENPINRRPEEPLLCLGNV